MILRFIFIFHLFRWHSIYRKDIHRRRVWMFARASIHSIRSGSYTEDAFKYFFGNGKQDCNQRHANLYSLHLQVRIVCTRLSLLLLSMIFTNMNFSFLYFILYFLANLSTFLLLSWRSSTYKTPSELANISRPGKSPTLAQLMRIHIVTPKAPIHVTLNPFVQMTPNGSPLFFPGNNEPINLSQSSYWVLRLPMIYETEEFGPISWPKDGPSNHCRLLKNCYGIADLVSKVKVWEVVFKMGDQHEWMTPITKDTSTITTMITTTSENNRPRKLDTNECTFCIMCLYVPTTTELVTTRALKKRKNSLY